MNSLLLHSSYVCTICNPRSRYTQRMYVRTTILLQLRHNIQYAKAEAILVTILILDYKDIGTFNILSYVNYLSAYFYYKYNSRISWMNIFVVSSKLDSWMLREGKIQQ